MIARLWAGRRFGDLKSDILEPEWEGAVERGWEKEQEQLGS